MPIEMGQVRGDDLGYNFKVPFSKTSTLHTPTSAVLFVKIRIIEVRANKCRGEIISLLLLLLLLDSLTCTTAVISRNSPLGSAAHRRAEMEQPRHAPLFPARSDANVAPPSSVGQFLIHET
jgi:hypothetical protein